MTNRIRDITVVNHRLDPHETELRILVEVENLTPTTEIKGRLMGPRNAFASTVEIAYPMREVQKGREMRVIIPEPSWWSPQSPFLYQGPLDLWQDGELVERIQISHGIRTLQLMPAGLRLNGQPFVLRGRMVEPPCLEADFLRFRKEGINTVVTYIDPSGGIDSWGWADRCGFFIIGSTWPWPEVFGRWKNELKQHPSNFGWAFLHDELTNPALEKSGDMFFGIRAPGVTIPLNASFVLGFEWRATSELPTSIPKIVITKLPLDAVPLRPDVIGWIESPTA